MGGKAPLDLSRWHEIEHRAQIDQYYAQGDAWMKDSGKGPLSNLGDELWEVAAQGGTITYGELERKFGLRAYAEGKNDVGMFSGIVSEYEFRHRKRGWSRRDSDIVLSSVVVNANSKRMAPPGLPGTWVWQDHPKPEDRDRLARIRQAKVWTFCATNSNPFRPAEAGQAARWFLREWGPWVIMAGTVVGILASALFIWVTVHGH